MNGFETSVYVNRDIHQVPSINSWLNSLNVMWIWEGRAASYASIPQGARGQLWFNQPKYATLFELKFPEYIVPAQEDTDAWN